MTDRPSSSRPAWWRSPRLPFLGIGLVSAFVFFAGIGHGDIHGIDPLILCTQAANILDTGNWVTLHYPDRTTAWFHHPPLAVWGAAICFQLFGVTIVAARIFTSLCGWGTTIVASAIGWRLRGPWAGFLSGLALISMPYFVKMCRRPRMDSTLCLFISLAVLGVLVTDRRKWGWWIFAGATGLAIHTKGVVGAAPLGIAPVFLWLAGRWSWREPRFWLATVIAMLIPVPWLSFHIRDQGWDFVEPYFGRLVLGAVRGEWADARPPWYFILSLPKITLPWLPFGLVGFWWIGRSAWRGERWAGGALSLVVWASVIFLAFSAVRQKHDYYMMPLLPPLAIATGLVLDALIPTRGKQGLAVVLVVAALVFAIVAPTRGIRLQTARHAELRALVDVMRATTSSGSPIHAYRLRPMTTEGAISFYARRRFGLMLRSEEELNGLVAERKFIYIYLRRADWDALAGPFQVKRVIGESGDKVYGYLMRPLDGSPRDR